MSTFEQKPDVGFPMIRNSTGNFSVSVGGALYRCSRRNKRASSRDDSPNDCKEPTVTLISRFLSDETAATAIEYGLIAAGISLAIIAVVNGLGTKLNSKFTAINTSLK
jgi:pilus assembly protein Flp/PilA